MPSFIGNECRLCLRWPKWNANDDYEVRVDAVQQTLVVTLTHWPDQWISNTNIVKPIHSRASPVVHSCTSFEPNGFIFMFLVQPCGQFLLWWPIDQRLFIRLVTVRMLESFTVDHYWPYAWFYCLSHVLLAQKWRTTRYAQFICVSEFSFARPTYPEWMSGLCELQTSIVSFLWRHTDELKQLNT